MSSAATQEGASLHAMAMAAREDALSPREAAEQIADSLADEELREALRIALPEYVAKIWRKQRSIARDPSGENRTDSRKWGQVGEDRWELELLRQQVCPRGVWKRFADCDVKDVLDLSTDYKRQAEQTERMHKCHEMLARVMNHRGHEKVSDVPQDDLKKIFNA